MVSLEFYFSSVFAALAIGACVPALILIRREPAPPRIEIEPPQAHAELEPYG